MPKNKNQKGVPSGHLSDVVSIRRQFLRSVRIDADVGREDALSGYVCQGTARSLLESMARQLVGTRQRAFTWTGPYGGGKSSLALMLCSLVGSHPKLRNRAKQILNLDDNSIVSRAFEAKGNGWVVVPVVGKRSSVIAELSAALGRATGDAPARRRPVDVIGELLGAAERNPQGVLVIIDELGKFLEASAQEGDDIYFFQELAEAASRSSGKLVVVGILHQAFDAYASRLGREARDEWAKVQGRFVDIPLVAATDEVIELVGKAIEVAEGPDLTEAAMFADRVAAGIRQRRPGTSPTIADSLKRCWPLHPVTASLLGPISKRRFGQNERSTFGFLASREPLGFVEFLNGYPAEWQFMYGPARYWDYLRANLEPAILASPDGHRWAQSAEAVERAESKGQEVHVQLAKTIALIEMFRNGSGLVADEAVLGISIQKATDVEIHKALVELAEWKVLIERKHLGAWGIYAGSDFDIEGAINSARGEIGQPDLTRISALSDLQPILAKRLYQQTGTMRWFARRIVRLTDIESFLAKFNQDAGSTGAFAMCLPDPGVPLKVAEQRIRAASKVSGNNTILLGTPSNAERIAELSLELAAVERVSSTRPELHGDTVARRELVGRTEAVRSALEEELADAFSLSRWFQCGEALGKEHGNILSAIASSLAAQLYHATPHIFSELLNRERPSSNSNKARKDLMYRMLTHGMFSVVLFESAWTLTLSTREGIQLIQAVFALQIFVSWILSICLWGKGSSQAGFYMLIFGVVEAGVLIRFARNIGWLPINFFTEYATLIATGLHLMALSIYLITRFRNMKEALVIEQRARTEQREFVGLVSHEFRTPMAIVSTSVQQLVANLDAPQDKMQERAGNIRQAVSRMERLLSEYLSVERLDTAHQPMKLVAMDFFEVIEEAVADWPLERIRLQVDELTEPFVCDPDMMRIVIRNLLENADRHAPPHTRIDLTVRAAPDGSLRMSVTDLGEGIPPEELPKLFQKFFRGRASQGTPGAGLGLYLVARIVTAHHGRITVENKVGQGVSFVLHLPAIKSPAEVPLTR